MLICNNTVYVYLFVVSTLSSMGEKMKLKSEDGHVFLMFLLYLIHQSLLNEMCYVYEIQYITVEFTQNWLLVLEGCSNAVVMKVIRIIQLYLTLQEEVMAAVEIFQTHTVLTRQL